MTTTGAEQAASSVLAFLIESSARGLVFAVVAGLALAVFRPRRAAVALCLWTVVLYAALAMPLLERVTPGIGIPIPAIAAAPESPASFSASVASNEPVVQLGTIAGGSPSRPAGNVPGGRPGPSGASIDPVTVAFIIYLIGVAVLLLRGGVGWVVTRRLERTTRPIEHADLLTRLARHAAAAGVKATPLLTESPSLLVPVTTSVLRPMIVLPESWRDWSAAKIDAVLAHEMAHIARRDTLTQRFSLIYRAIFWPNPFSWWLHHRLAALAEQVSDEAALNAGVDRATYAETLVGFFAEQQRGAGRRAVWHVAMARGGSAGAEQRVERVLAWERGRSVRLTKTTVIGLLLAAAPVMAMAAAARPEAPAAPPLELRASPPTPAPHVEQTNVAGHTNVAGPLTRPPVADSATNARPPAPQPTEGLPDIQVTDATSHVDRMWVLLFDLAGMPAADVSQAVMTASRWVDAMPDRDAVAVTSIGSTRGLAFTHFKAPVRNVLANLEHQQPIPGGASDVVTQLRAVRTLCENLGAIDQRKAMLYFGPGIRGTGASAGENVEGVLDACDRANVSIYTVDSRGLSALLNGQPASPQGAVQPVTTPKTGVGLSLAVNQKDCPVTLLSTTSNVTDGAYVTVVARNDSAKVVRSVTVAAVVSGGHDNYFRTEPLRFFTSPALGTWIPPAESRTLESHVIDMKTLEALAAGSEATLGVVSVDFADGSTWTYDIKTKGAFERAQVPSGNGLVIYKPGNGLTTPVLLRKADPQYTDEARRAKIQGDVELDAVVLADGSVGDVRVTKSLDWGFGLDSEAIRSAKQWTFKPALKSGQPVAMIVGLIIEFRLPAGPGPGVIPPKAIKRVAPRYTSETMREKIEGNVEVDVTVLKDGTVGDARVTKSLDSRLDQEALAAARQWVFLPATKDGQPVDFAATLSLEFRMHPSALPWANAYPENTPGLVAPVPIRVIDPKYTSDAMRAKIQGDVEVLALVTAEGTISEVRISKSLDTQYGLDKEAIAAAKQFTFTPAALNGQRVAAIVRLTILFRLH